MRKYENPMILVHDLQAEGEVLEDFNPTSIGDDPLGSPERHYAPKAATLVSM